VIPGGDDQRYQYRPVFFFMATTVASWTPWLVGAYVSRGGQGALASLWNLVGLLAPLVVGLALILGSGHRALKADLLDRLVNIRRIRPGSLFPILIIPPVAMLLSMALSVLLGQSADQFRLASGSNLGAMILVAMVLAPIIEETGWRGYGVDSLRSRLLGRATAVLFGVLWSAWHAPLVVVPGSYQHELAAMDNPLFLANFFVSVVPAAVIANWVYYRTNRSILAGIILHSVLNASAVLPNAGQVAKVIVTVIFGVIAWALVVFDRTTFAGGPRNFVTDPDSAAVGLSGHPREASQRIRR
jgi:uncharacterized protein